VILGVDRASLLALLTTEGMVHSTALSAVCCYISVQELLPLLGNFQTPPAVWAVSPLRALGTAILINALPTTFFSARGAHEL
jgi:hypothetical protein